MKRFFLSFAILMATMMVFATPQTITQCDFTTPNGRFNYQVPWCVSWNMSSKQKITQNITAAQSEQYRLAPQTAVLYRWDEEMNSFVEVNEGELITEGRHQYMVNIESKDVANYVFHSEAASISVTMDGQPWTVTGIESDLSAITVISPEFDVFPDQLPIDGIVYSFLLKDHTAMVMPAMAYDKMSGAESDPTGEERYEGDIVIPSKVMHKGQEFEVNVVYVGTFADCPELTSVSFPETTTELSEWTFGVDEGKTSKLKKIECKAVKVPKTDKDAFGNLDLSQIEPVVPNEALAAYAADPVWGQFWAATKTVYLRTSYWSNGDEVDFYVHTWGFKEADIKMEFVDQDAIFGGELYKAEIPEKNDKVIFVRQSKGAETISWSREDYMANRTCDLVIPMDRNCYVISDWSDGACDNVYEGSDEKYSGGVWADGDAKFYITGNKALLEDLECAATEWSSNAYKVKDIGCTLNLKKDRAYQLKLTNGTWTKSLGGFNLERTPLGVGSTSDGNITFSLDEDGQVTIELIESEGWYYIRLDGKFHIEGNIFLDGYAIIGPDWSLSLENEENIWHMVENPYAPEGVEEYIGTRDLAVGDKFKVVEVKDDQIIKWFPDGMGNEYTVDAEHAGKEMWIFFRPAGNDAWKSLHESGFFWITSEEPGVQAISNVQSDKVQCTKVLRDGQMIILRDNKTYNVLGSEMK